MKPPHNQVAAHSRHDKSAPLVRPRPVRTIIMKISWDEPKSSYWPRWKQKVKDVFKSTAWYRVSFWLFVVLPSAIALCQYMSPNPRFKWSYLPLIFMIVTPFACFMTALQYFMNRPKVTVDDEGIKLRGPEDGIFSNHSYSKITSISLIYTETGNAALSWEYKGKTISRGIPFGVDLGKLQTIIEWNSNLKLINRLS